MAGARDATRSTIDDGGGSPSEQARALVEHCYQGRRSLSAMLRLDRKMSEGDRSVLRLALDVLNDRTPAHAQREAICLSRELVDHQTPPASVSVMKKAAYPCGGALLSRSSGAGVPNGNRKMGRAG
jgi:hypothetical protein